MSLPGYHQLRVWFRKLQFTKPSPRWDDWNAVTALTLWDGRLQGKDSTHTTSAFIAWNTVTIFWPEHRSQYKLCMITVYHITVGFHTCFQVGSKNTDFCHLTGFLQFFSLILIDLKDKGLPQRFRRFPQHVLRLSTGCLEGIRSSQRIWDYHSVLEATCNLFERC